MRRHLQHVRRSTALNSWQHWTRISLWIDHIPVLWYLWWVRTTNGGIFYIVVAFILSIKSLNIEKISYLVFRAGLHVLPFLDWDMDGFHSFAYGGIRLVLPRLLHYSFYGRVFRNLDRSYFYTKSLFKGRFALRCVVWLPFSKFCASRSEPGVVRKSMPIWSSGYLLGCITVSFMKFAQIVKIHVTSVSLVMLKVNQSDR